MKKIIAVVIGITLLLIPDIEALAETSEEIIPVFDIEINFKEKNGWVEENGKRYYYEDGQMVHGFKEIEGKTYFFGITKGALLTGWQELPEGRFYLYEDGSVKQGWNEIEGKKYYVENNYVTRGFKEIEGKTYFFGITKGALLTGWQELPEGRFYLYEDGSVKQGWNEIEGKKYYVENNYVTRGFKEIEGKTYFFGITKGTLLTGWQELPEGRFYLYEDGSVKQGWQTIEDKTYYVKDNYIVRGTLEINEIPYNFNEKTGALIYGVYITEDNQVFIIDKNGNRLYGWQKVEGKTYYIETDGYAVHGFKEIEGKTYFFGITKGALLTGWQELPEGRFYLYEDGSVKQGWNEIEGKKYYVENNYVVRGAKELDEKIYYFNNKTGELKTGKYNENGNECYYDEYGKLIKKQYIPKYYSQKDSKWANTYYGSGNMKNTGCAPTAMAMVFDRILGRTILPIDVAYYLYHNTSEFNKPILGASGLAVQKAATHFGILWKGISTQKQLEEALSAGKIVFANVGPGKFTKPGLTHAIVLYKIENGTTYAMDPYNSGNNGKISIVEVWNQRSNNSYDLRGGYAFYALG